MQINVKSRLESWMGDPKGISYEKLVKNILSLRKKSGYSEEVKILSNLITPGVFRKVDKNNDRFISSGELNTLAGADSDESDVSPDDIYKSSEHLYYTYRTDIKFSYVPDWFKNDIYEALGSIPSRLRDFVFKKVAGSSFRLELAKRLLSDIEPDPEFKEKMYYSSGATYNNEHVKENIPISDKKIRLSTLRRNNETNEVKENDFVKHTVNHEFGHAFDFQLYVRYVNEREDPKYQYHSTSEHFKKAYESDVGKLEEKIDGGIVPEADIKKLSRFLGKEADKGHIGHEEVFAECFASIMSTYDLTEYKIDNSKRILKFLEYFPECTKIVLEGIDSLERGFSENFHNFQQIKDQLSNN